MEHYISLGAGVQSSTMALMAACGEIKPMPAGAIFADTQAEPASVYKWLDWLKKQLPFPVYTRTFRNLTTEALRLQTSRKTGIVNNAYNIPLFLKKPDGSQGILPRQCTTNFKIRVVQRTIRQLQIGKARCAPGEVIPPVVQWIGISYDEADRMKDSSECWITNYYPLVLRRITRQGCLTWMEKKGFPRPPRSACVFCPFRDDPEWIRMRKEEPESFAAAVKFDYAVRKLAKKINGFHQQAIPYVHRDMVPLDKVKFSPESKRNSFRGECEGMCGV